MHWDILTMRSTLGMIVHELDSDLWCNEARAMCVACTLDEVWNALLTLIWFRVCGGIESAQIYELLI